MLASVLKNDRFSVENLPNIQKGKFAAVVKVHGCGLCGSDIVKYTHKFVKDGAVLGHEVVGEIVEINVKSEFKIGDRVVVAHHYPCLECNFCKHGSYSMCKTFKNSNIFPGGFSEYIGIDENHLKYTVFKLSAAMDEVEASFTEPLACCYRAVKRAELLKDDKILIIGLGSIGILMGQACKTFGCKVIGTDINPVRLDLALKYGFDEVYLSQNMKNTQADVAFLTAGADKTVETAIEQVRNGGKICVFASTKTDVPSFANNQIYYKELTVFGSYSPSPDDLKKAFELIRDNEVNVKGMSEFYDLKNLNDAIFDTVNGKILKAFVRIN